MLHPIEKLYEPISPLTSTLLGVMYLRSPVVGKIKRFALWFSGGPVAGEAKFDVRVAGVSQFPLLANMLALNDVGAWFDQKSGLSIDVLEGTILLLDCRSLTGGSLVGPATFLVEIDDQVVYVTGAALSTDGTFASNSDAKVPSEKATKTYADSLVIGLLDDRGNYDASGNVFPSTGGSGSAGAIKKGDLWTISVSGTLGGTSLTPGDIVRALVDTPGQTAGNWALTEHDLGYVPVPATRQVAGHALTSDVTLVKGDVGLGNVDNTSDANKPVSTAQATADALVLSTAETYADSLVVGLLDDRGAYDASGNVFPTTGGSGPAGAVKKGDIWNISVAGTLGGTAVGVGDWVRALIDTPGQTAGNWSIIPKSSMVAGTLPAGGTTNQILKKNSGTNYDTSWEDLPPSRPTTSTVTSASSITVNSDTADEKTVTALAADATVANPTGSPVNGQRLVYRIKDNGTARALTWDTEFRTVGVNLPVTTVISKTLYVEAWRNSTDSKWDIVTVRLEGNAGVTMGGDVTGTSDVSTVTKLQNRAVQAWTPSTLLGDNFDDNTFDSASWTVKKDSGAGTPTESSQQINFFSNANNTFDKASWLIYTGVTITEAVGLEIIADITATNVLTGSGVGRACYAMLGVCDSTTFTPNGTVTLPPGFLGMVVGKDDYNAADTKRTYKAFSKSGDTGDLGANFLSTTGTTAITTVLPVAIKLKFNAGTMVGSVQYTVGGAWVQVFSHAFSATSIANKLLVIGGETNSSNFENTQIHFQDVSTSYATSDQIGDGDVLMWDRINQRFKNSAIVSGQVLTTSGAPIGAPTGLSAGFTQLRYDQATHTLYAWNGSTWDDQVF